MSTRRLRRAFATGCLVAGAVFVAAGTAVEGSASAEPAPESHVPPMQSADMGPVGPIKAPGGPFLEDRYGRVVLFHGVDLVYKIAPYEVVVSGKGRNVLTTAQARRMQSLGFTAVRLGILWKGLEPGTDRINNPDICREGTPRSSSGQFDASVFDSYIKKLDATIALLAHYGIYSLLDMHQDVYNEVFGGEGAPNWAVCTNGAKPHPKLNQANWSVNLNGPGVAAAYAHFWHNDVVGDLQGEFDSIWARVAAHYRSNPWVLGYDPFNEPWGQGLPPTAYNPNFDGELQCFYAGRADPGVNQLGQQLHCPKDDPEKGVIPQIEAADPTHPVFYETNFATGSAVGSFIGPMPFPRLVLNFHDYCFLHVPNGPEPPSYATTCTPLENADFTVREKERERDSTPEQPGGPATLLTEFGATTDTADLARVTADANAHLTGWMYWQWIRYDDPTGSHDSGLWPPSAPTQSMLEVLSQPYAEAISGTPTSTSYDPGSDRFSLVYRPGQNIKAPTVIFVPVEMHYGGGYCATATGGRVVSAPDAMRLLVDNTPGANDVNVTVTPGHC